MTATKKKKKNQRIFKFFFSILFYLDTTSVFNHLEILVEVGTDMILFKKYINKTLNW